MGVEKGYVSVMGQPPEQFTFRKRRERIDWRKIASVDLEMLSRTLNFSTLQENILNVAFCDISSELDLRTVDTNYVKLFQLSQYIIEYLLHSQDYLCANINNSQQAIEQLTQELSKVKSLDDSTQTEIERIKKESHKRKRIIAIQQKILHVGTEAYHKCPHCVKAFMNNTFLKAHITRRHPDSASLIHECPATRELEGAKASISQQSRELEILRAELRLAEQRLNDEQSARAVLEGIPSRSQNERELRKHLENWKQEELKNHETEREHYLRDLNELNEKKRLAEEALAALQKLHSRCIRLEEGGIVEAEDLRKQREQQLRDRLPHMMSDGTAVALDDVDERRVRENMSGTLAKSRQSERTDEAADVERSAVNRKVGSAPLVPPRDEILLNSGVGDMMPASDDEETSLATSRKTFDTTGSLSLAHESQHRLAMMKNALTLNPDLLKNMRDQVLSDLNDRLNKKGIKPESESVKDDLTRAVINSLKSDRLSTAQKTPNFFDIRNRYYKSLAEQAMTKFKKFVAASLPASSAIATSSSAAAAQATPTRDGLTGGGRSLGPAVLSPIQQSMQSNATLSESSGRWDTDDEGEELEADPQPVNQTQGGGVRQQGEGFRVVDNQGGTDKIQRSGAYLQVPQQPVLKPAIKLSPRASQSGSISEDDDWNDASIQSLSYNSIDGARSSHLRSSGPGPLVSIGEPSTSAWTQDSKGGKKTKNSVTFSDDLESTDGGGMSVRDL